jgi:hypothetical protein
MKRLPRAFLIDAIVHCSTCIPARYSPLRICNACDPRPEIGDEFLQYDKMGLEFRRQVATGLSSVCGNLRAPAKK